MSDGAAAGRQHLPLAAFGAVCAATAAVVASTWGWTYWDFGDGNYLYVGRRINDGLVPYRDILAPQPPLHLLTAAWSQRIGAWFGSDLLGARVFSLLVRMAQAALVYVCALKLFRSAWTAALAGAIYLWLPIGFWWSLCLMSENLEIVFLLVAFLGVLSLRERWILLAGAASALAMHCNMTGVPYFLVNLLFLACRRPRLAVYYASTGLGVWIGGGALAWMWAGPAYLENVVLNQAGSFPRADILALSGQTPFDYYWGKISSQGGNVLALNTGWFVLALGALSLRVKEACRLDPGGEPYLRWEYAAWSALGMFLSIGFTMKGGTMDYIFVLGEPALALFAADGLARLSVFLFPRGRALGALRFRHTLPILRVVFPACLVALLAFHPRSVQQIRMVLREEIAELPEREVERVREMIEAYAQPGDMILAPPFYAYLTNTIVAGELAENYLWSIKVMNEIADGVEGEGIYKMREIAGMIRRREIPLVMLDMNLTGNAPFVRQALLQHYVPLEPGILRTRNTPLELWVPRGTAITHEPLLGPRPANPAEEPRDG